jgi:tetratricopeptide (TPR) repeat protein
VKKIALPGLLMILLSVSFDLAAHGQIPIQIEDVSRQLVDRPDDAGLLLRRATLWYEQGFLDKALEDTRRVLKQNPDSRYALLLSGRLNKDLQNFPGAWQSVSRFVSLFPEEAQGYLLRARILRNLPGGGGNVISDYSKAISLLKHPRPELFLERADIQLQQGESGVTLALQQFAEARERHGFLYVLQKGAFDVAHDAGQYTEATALAVDITNHMQRKEQWLKIQGDLLRTTGDYEEAKNRYRAAQAAIKLLPGRLQNHPHVVSLNQELMALLIDPGN